MADEDEYQDAFVQADDATLMSAIKQREAQCTPLMK